MFCCSATDVGRRLRCPSHSSEIGILIAQCYKRFVVEKSGNTSGSGSVGFNATAAVDACCNNIDMYIVLHFLKPLWS